MTLTKYYLTYLAPLSADIDNRRREFILNVSLFGFVSLGFLATLVAMAAYGVVQDAWYMPNVILTVLFAAIIISLLRLSRQGNSQLTAMAFLLFISTIFVLNWGVHLPSALLVFALVIVVAGVLFTTPHALRATAFGALIILVVGVLQNAYWVGQSILLGDIIGYILLFVLIGIVSWQSNWETDSSLLRARSSEKALAKERDSLEQKVLERTRELEDLQVARLLEMQPFAEFGRIGASLVHDIANPLTAASLHLEELNKQQHSELVRQVQRNLMQLEKYLAAARKQIRRESDLRTIFVGAEIKQIVQLMTHRARRAGVKIELSNVTKVTLYGDVVKFDQILANLLANAIDASKDLSAAGQPVVKLRVSLQNEAVVITVTDYGVGISDQQIGHIFEPFYSTKATPRGGLGLGLSLVKQYIETDFRGTITVASNPAVGTTFTLKFKGQKR